MASPQCENGYTRISHELLERIISGRFTAAQLKVILAIIRRTYGYSKKMDALSLGQISQMTGIDGRSNVARTLRQLIKMNVIIKESTRYISLYGIQKDYEQWDFKCCQRRQQSGQTTVTSDSDSVISGDYRSAVSGDNHNRKERTKEKWVQTASQVPCQSIVDDYNAILVSAGLPKIVKLTSKRRTLIKARWNESNKTCDAEWWRRFFRQVAQTRFLVGDNQRGWRADFDWLLKQENFIKIIEGTYSR